jgi:hypothetical protein
MTPKFLPAFAIAAVLAIGLQAPAEASQCPPYGAVCAGLTCSGAVGGYCCCKPYCNVQRNGTLKCGCNNFCDRTCDKACSGLCDGGPCYVGGQAAAEDSPVVFRLSERAAGRARGQPYGILVTEALAAACRDTSDSGTWTSGGTVEASALGEPHASQANRYVAFKAVWNETAEQAEARIVFDDPVDAPAPVSVTIRKNGRLVARPLSAEEVEGVLAATDASAWALGGPVEMTTHPAGAAGGLPDR